MRSAIVVILLLSIAPAFAADKPEVSVDDAISRGQAYLAKQQRDDGWWDHQQRPAGQDADATEHRRAITSLCLLAFLSTGHTPDAGKFGGNLRRAVDALTDAVPTDGYIGAKDGKPMYTQAIVTLALSQAYGVEPLADRRVKQHAALVRLVQVIVQAQGIRKEAAFVGGWRYTREAPDSDLSLSGWNALALRASQNAGIPIPKDSLRRAADFVARCYNKDLHGFGYQPGGAVQTGTTSTGIVCLSLLNHEARSQFQDVIRTLPERPTDAKAFDTYPCYGLFYYLLAIEQIGSQSGDEANRAVVRGIHQRLIKAQLADGGWPRDWPDNSQEPGRVYRSAMSLLGLSVSIRILPAFQR